MIKARNAYVESCRHEEAAVHFASAADSALAEVTRAEVNCAADAE